MDKKRGQAEIPGTEEFEALKVSYNTGSLAVNTNKSQHVNCAIERQNKRLKETGQIGKHGKGLKRKKSPSQIWPYPEKEYSTRGINGLSYKEKIIPLLYQFAEEVMARNPGKMVYVIEDNAPAHQKASRLCEQERKEKGINKTNWIANSPDLHAIESLWWPSKVRLNHKWNEIQGGSQKAKDEAREAIRQDWISRANQAVLKRVCEG